MKKVKLNIQYLRSLTTYRLVTKVKKVAANTTSVPIGLLLKSAFRVLDFFFQFYFKFFFGARLITNDEMMKKYHTQAGNQNEDLGL